METGQQDIELERQAKKKNMEFFLTRIIYWFIALALLTGISSWLVMTVPSQTDVRVVYWIVGFASFVLVGIIISRVVNFKHYIVRHGIIVKNTPEIQQVIREEEEVKDTIKPSGRTCDKCGSTDYYVDGNSAVCGKCGVGVHL